jgi:hypothetical protein
LLPGWAVFYAGRRGLALSALLVARVVPGGPASPAGRASVSPIRFASSLIATHSGLRGRPAVDLTPDVVAAAVGGFVELLLRRSLPPTIAVASDERREGRALAREAIRTALACGADVIELGAVSTPTAKLAARARGLGGAVRQAGGASHRGGCIPTAVRRASTPAHCSRRWRRR